jgi:hypothetical protein
MDTKEFTTEGLKDTEGSDDTTSPRTRATGIDTENVGGFLAQKELLLQDHKKHVEDVRGGRTRTIMDGGALCVL